ncbi:retropepsin-like aspartic protease family protein [Teredinibacter haidensis]|uniref:retropepsin-like aspartic protease family protein n=1 Tax=Teredinibacter haidensis TaxID=2731755 RepID=UPI0009491A3E|nr:TIGR02281 family clan AA aspartic protease [Teredinibacter haidensis]
MVQRFKSHYWFAAWLLLQVVVVEASPAVEVKGLFKGSAIFVIDGQQRLLKQGKTSPEGVKLIESNSKFALVEIDGKRHKLRLSRAVGGQYQTPDKAIVRLPSGHNGHYLATGSINGRSTKFLVDTGASSIAISSQQATSLGVKYRHGNRQAVSTANGMVNGFEINLSKVIVGTITLNNVRAVVIEGSSPRQILLGNSFLSRVNMRVEQGVLILQAKY